MQLNLKTNLKLLLVFGWETCFGRLTKSDYGSQIQGQDQTFSVVGLTLKWVIVFGCFHRGVFCCCVTSVHHGLGGRKWEPCWQSVSKHLYPQVIEKCHLCPQNTTLIRFNMPHCLHEPDSPLKYLFCSSQADIKEFLHQWSLPSCLEYAVCSPLVLKHAPLLNQPQPRDQ